MRHLPRSKLKKFKAIAKEVEEAKFKMIEQIGPLAFLTGLI
jgi:hypothetical protein